jgi:hypothetical protein
MLGGSAQPVGNQLEHVRPSASRKATVARVLIGRDRALAAALLAASVARERSKNRKNVNRLT